LRSLGAGIGCAAITRGRIARGAHDPASGSAKLANYFVGQIVGSMNEPKPAARVVMDMVEEFIEAVQRVESMME